MRLPRAVLDLPHYPWLRKRHAVELAPAAGQNLASV